jgi:hypothetical protein
MRDGRVDIWDLDEQFAIILQIDKRHVSLLADAGWSTTMQPKPWQTSCFSIAFCRIVFGTFSRRNNAKG